MKDYKLKTTIFTAALTLIWCLGICMSSPPVFAEPIVIDYTAVEEFDQIPDEYIEAVKNLALDLQSTNVGLEIIVGLVFLELDDPNYAIELTIDGESIDEGPGFHISVETER